MNFQKSLIPNNSSVIVKNLNHFLKVNKLCLESYCRVFENDRVLITICHGDRDIGTIYFREDGWRFSYFYGAQSYTSEDISKKAAILIDCWIALTLNVNQVSE